MSNSLQYHPPSSPPSPLFNTIPIPASLPVFQKMRANLTIPEHEQKIARNPASRLPKQKTVKQVNRKMSVSVRATQTSILVWAFTVDLPVLSGLRLTEERYRN